MARLAGVQMAGADLIDVGCGVGHDAFICLALSAASVTGFDVDGYQVEFFNRLADVCGCGERCRAVESTAGAIDRDDSSADIVLCNEALSHFIDWRSFLGESWRVLRPGGVLAIADGNNALNGVTRRRRQALWHRRETGEGLVDGEQSYCSRRRDLIAGRFPDLDRQTLDLLAEGTFGMASQEAFETCSHYLLNQDRGELSFYSPRSCPVDPGTGGYAERLIDPRNVEHTARALGFATGYYARCGNRTPFWLLNRLFAWTTRLAIFIAPAFIVIAAKPAEPPPAGADDRPQPV
jgi:ubiquinone/menaquinone biosynthesis C-methylase UbiE